MVSIKLKFDEPAWTDLVDPGRMINIETPIEITGLERGMSSGAPSVAIRADLPDGRAVIIQTSLKLFLTAADGLKVRYGDPR